LDLLLGGNLYASKPEVGRYDACYGTYLENTGEGTFKYSDGNKGFKVDGEVRDIQVVGKKVYVVRNNASVVAFECAE
jgi:enediyne biosynthesis protein E4